MARKPGSDSPSPKTPPIIDDGVTQSLADPDATEGGSRPVFVQLQPGGQPVPGYELVEKLGAGGFGEVWKAKGPGGFGVALKFLRLDASSGSPEVRALDVMKDIRHANLLAQFGCWNIGGYLIIAMELGDRTLFHRLLEAETQGQRGIPGPELLDYLRDAARGLDYLHELGIQHRDIKPQNFLLVGSSLKVADFGLAKLIDKNLASNSGSMTPAYAAPEFFRGKTDIHSDQYSLAVSYCQLRGGKLPFEGSTTEMMYGHLENQPDLDMLPEVERAVVARALAKKPEERWPTCRAFVQALAHSMATPDYTEQLPRQMILSNNVAPETVAPPPVTAPPPAAGRSPWLPVALAAAALALVGGAVAWSLRDKSQEEPRKAQPVAEAGTNTGSPSKEEPPKKDEPPGKSDTVKKDEDEKTVEKTAEKGKEKMPPIKADTGKEKMPPIKPIPVSLLKLEPLDRVSLKRGTTGTVTVKVARENVAGPVALELEGLPAGVKAFQASIPADADTGKVELTADAGAKATTGEVTLVARAGELRASGKFHLEVTAPPAALAREVSNALGMKLVLISPGKFQMGSPDDEIGRKDDEGPQHEVILTRPFYLGKFEVTRGQFRTFVTDTGYETEAEKDGKGAHGYNAKTKAFEGPDPKYYWKNTGFSKTDEHPVVDLSWNDARAFCAWLSKKESRKYDLPTEAEWEYACRAGTNFAYPIGDAEEMVTVANLADGTLRQKFPALSTVTAQDGYAFTAPVGQFKPNGWGLFDMHGNVWEWCRDWWSAGAYKDSPSEDPTGPAEGEKRVIRGGSWSNPPAHCRAANRGKYASDYRHPTIGFRVALYPE